MCLFKILVVFHSKCILLHYVKNTRVEILQVIKDNAVDTESTLARKADAKYINMPTSNNIVTFYSVRLNSLCTTCA